MQCLVLFEERGRRCPPCRHGESRGHLFLPVLPAQTQPLPSPWLPALSACLAPEEIA